MSEQSESPPGRGGEHREFVASSSAQPYRNRRRRVVAAVAGVAVTLIVFAPTIVAHTALRHSLVNKSLGRYGLSGMVNRASLAWNAVITLEGVEFNDNSGRVAGRVDRLVSGKTLLNLVLSGSESDSFEIRSPRLDVVLSDEGRWPLDRRQPPGRRPWSAAISDAALTIRQVDGAAPVVDLRELNVDVTMRSDDSGRVLAVGPITIADRAPLSPEFADRGLRLITPLLADATRMTGEVSIALDQMRIKLPVGNELSGAPDIAGTVVFHNVTAQLKNPIVNQMTQMIARRAEIDIPQSVQIVGDSEVRFHVHADGVSHEGLVFVLPEFSNDVVVRSSGAVNFDETLDLKIELALPQSLAGDVPILASLLHKPIAFRVTGDVAEPEIALPSGRTLLDEVTDRIVPAGSPASDDDNLTSAIINLVGGLSDTSETPAESLPGDILRVIRAAEQKIRRDDRHDESQETPE